MTSETQTISWFDKLLAQYPSTDDDDDGNCTICAEENGLCQLAAETIVTDVAWNCDADEEDVARWVVLNDIAIVGQSTSQLSEQYNEREAQLVEVSAPCRANREGANQ